MENIKFLTVQLKSVFRMMTLWSFSSVERSRLPMMVCCSVCDWTIVANKITLISVLTWQVLSLPVACTLPRACSSLSTSTSWLRTAAGMQADGLGIWLGIQGGYKKKWEYQPTLFLVVIEFLDLYTLWLIDLGSFFGLLTGSLSWTTKWEVTLSASRQSDVTWLRCVMVGTWIILVDGELFFVVL